MVFIHGNFLLVIFAMHACHQKMAVLILQSYSKTNSNICLPFCAKLQTSNHPFITCLTSRCIMCQQTYIFDNTLVALFMLHHDIHLHKSKYFRIRSNTQHKFAKLSNRDIKSNIKGSTFYLQV